MNALCRRLGIRYPILQAPMAGVSTPAMAAAVAEAGGLGGLPVGHLDPEGARAVLRQAREMTRKPLNVNLFCHERVPLEAGVAAAWLASLKPHFEGVGAQVPESLTEPYRGLDDQMLAMLLEEHPEVVSFHFGLPGEATVRALREAGCVLMGSATSVAEGHRLEAAGVSAVVAQGIEAGGHRGMFDPDAPDAQLSTAVLTRELALALGIPVISAGGVMDGAGVAAMLQLGASAAMLGTAYLLCPEAQTDPGYRAALAVEGAMTVMTRAISGRPARCLVNRFTAVDGSKAPPYPWAYSVGKALHQAAKAQGESGYGAQWAGQGVGLLRALPAGELTAQLAREAGWS